MRGRKPTTNEKIQLWWKKNKPGHKSPLVDAPFEIKSIGPMDFNTQGMPSYGSQKVVVGIGGMFFIAMWFLNDACATGSYVMDATLLGQLNLLATVSLGAVFAAMIWIFIDSHKGTFQHYIMVIQTVWRHLDGRDTQYTELRVLDSWQIWPLKHSVVEQAEKVELEIELEMKAALEDQLGDDAFDSLLALQPEIKEEQKDPLPDKDALDLLLEVSKK